MKTLSNTFKKSLFGPIDLFDCGTRMVNTIGPRIADDERGKQLTECLNNELTNLNIVTERDRAIPQTALIMESDAKRDELLFMFRDIIKGNTHNIMNPEARKAANAFSRLYADHIGYVTRMGLGEESKAVRYLLDEFSTGENIHYAEILGIAPVISSLAGVQSEIEALYVERTGESLGRFTIKTQMEATGDALRRFLGYLDVLIADGTQEYAVFGENAFAIIGDVEAIARGRKTTMHNGEDGQPEEPLQQAA